MKGGLSFTVRFFREYGLHAVLFLLDTQPMQLGNGPQVGIGDHEQISEKIYPCLLLVRP